MSTKMHLPTPSSWRRKSRHSEREEDRKKKEITTNKTRVEEPLRNKNKNERHRAREIARVPAVSIPGAKGVESSMPGTASEKVDSSLTGFKRHRWSFARSSNMLYLTRECASNSMKALSPIQSIFLKYGALEVPGVVDGFESQVQL